MLPSSLYIHAGIDQREGVLKTPIHLPPRSSTPAYCRNQDHETVREEPDSTRIRCFDRCSRTLRADRPRNDGKPLSWSISLLSARMFSAMLTISPERSLASSTASTTINPSMVSMVLFSAPGDAIGRSKTTDQVPSNNSKTKALIVRRHHRVDTSKSTRHSKSPTSRVGPLQRSTKAVCPQGRCRRRA